MKRNYKRDVIKKRKKWERFYDLLNKKEKKKELKDIKDLT